MRDFSPRDQLTYVFPVMILHVSRAISKRAQVTFTVDKFGGDMVLDKYEVVFKRFEAGSNNWEYIAPADLLVHVNMGIDTKTDSHHASRANDGRNSSVELCVEMRMFTQNSASTKELHLSLKAQPPITIQSNESR